eukprot:CAMPEP_0178987902 /NCGR_PEP_ID=MMETSP0795-20121207/3526_1 /TAXON_ID=88552 /ORGANISM="Amoebophrya sp., Strain Ameob2" /LENGTH=340 /DNA_ID=CAMNT_0020679143 /DNA_START=73 /DNA_END=1096 /DNA_ORIENTATION=+
MAPKKPSGKPKAKAKMVATRKDHSPANSSGQSGARAAPPPIEQPPTSSSSAFPDERRAPPSSSSDPSRAREAEDLPASAPSAAASPEFVRLRGAGPLPSIGTDATGEADEPDPLAEDLFGDDPLAGFLPEVVDPMPGAAGESSEMRGPAAPRQEGPAVDGTTAATTREVGHDAPRPSGTATKRPAAAAASENTTAGNGEPEEAEEFGPLEHAMGLARFFDHCCRRFEDEKDAAVDPGTAEEIARDLRSLRNIGLDNVRGGDEEGREQGDTSEDSTVHIPEQLLRCFAQGKSIDYFWSVVRRGVAFQEKAQKEKGHACHEFLELMQESFGNVQKASGRSDA